MIYELAAVAGIDPGPCSLRHLSWAAEAAERERWNHTANLLSLIAEVNRNASKRRRPFQAAEFHPFYAASLGSGRTPLTPDALRARAKAWHEKQQAKQAPCPPQPSS